MSDYVPTTESVRSSYGEQVVKETYLSWEEAVEAFDRWLAAHDRQTAERAWQEGHGDPECDEWIVSGMCAEYHPNPYREAVQS